MFRDWRIFVILFVVFIFVIWLFFSNKESSDINLKTIIEDVIPSEENLRFKTGTDNEEYHIQHNFPSVEYKQKDIPVVQRVNEKPVIKAIERQDYASNGEWECAKALKYLFPRHSFTKVRPNWLKNPETGRNLELDFFNEELRLGVEYNGIQHYVYPNNFCSSKEKFINQLRRDKFKIDRCDIMGVYLIIVPYNVDFKNIRHFIYEKLPEDLK